MSLSAYATTVLGALLGGAGFRLRGWSGFARITGRGATTARLACWAVPMGVLAWFAGADWSLALMVGTGLYLGTLAPWWRSITLGRVRLDGPALGQYVRHAARGMLWTLPAALLLGGSVAPVWWALGGSPFALDVWRPALVLAAAGLACVPAYEIGWRLWPARATELGEVLFGAAIGAAVARAVMP